MNAKSLVSHSCNIDLKVFENIIKRPLVVLCNYFWTIFFGKEIYYILKLLQCKIKFTFNQEKDLRQQQLNRECFSSF